MSHRQVSITRTSPPFKSCRIFCTDSYTNPNTDCDFDTDTDTNSNGHCDCNCNRNRHRHRNADRNRNSHRATAATATANCHCTATPTATATATATPTATATATPAAPRALTATNVTATSFTANWSSVSGASGYRLDVATDASFCQLRARYQNLDVGNVTSRNVTGLTPNTQYYYRLRAYNGNGTSPNSNVIKVKTKPH